MLSSLRRSAPLLFVSLVACENLPVESTISLSVDLGSDWPASLPVGDTVDLQLDIRDPSGRVVTDIAVGWSASDSSTVLLLPAGGELSAGVSARAVGLKRGTTSVRASVDLGDRHFERSVEATIRVLERWLTVSAGGAQTCAVSTNGEAACWGFGALGDGSLSSPTPRSVQMAGGTTLADVTVRGGLPAHACAVGASTIGFCWGTNSAGELGIGAHIPYAPVPQPAPAYFVPLRAMSAGGPLLGGGFTCGLTESAAQVGNLEVGDYVICWGSNHLGTIGLGSLTGGEPCTPSDPLDCYFTPESFVEDDGGQWLEARSVSAGSYHVCAVAIDEVAYCWGRGDAGQLGSSAGAVCPGGFPITSADTIPVACGLEPQRVGGAETYIDISASEGLHTCGVETGGSARCWGANSHGQLGGTTTQSCVVSYTPLASGRVSVRCSTLPVAAAAGLRFSSVDTGEMFSCGVSIDQDAYCWGRNNAGQLGAESTGLCANPFDAGAREACSRTPLPVSGGLKFQSISVGMEHACGITSPDGAAYCWGDGGSGQLGNGGRNDSVIPVRVAEPPPTPD